MLITNTEGYYIITIALCCAAGGLYAGLQAWSISCIDIKKEAEEHADMYDIDEKESLISTEVKGETLDDDFDKMTRLVKLEYYGGKIADGATAFLWAEYKIMAIFIVIFAAFVYGIVDIVGANKQAGNKYYPYATIAFIIGSLTSILCGYLGMKIAVMANYRTTFKAMNKKTDQAYEGAFDLAYKAGCVMGFGLVSISLFVLVVLMVSYIYIFRPNVHEGGDRTFAVLMDLIAGYGLGGSAMALFGRVGGGIYTKAADVGADLAGKVCEGLAEDDPKNPATIADNVGDNVGDIAGMGSDLFGSLAESTCAALVLISSNTSLFTPDNMQVIWYPIMISAAGIVACLITVQFAFYVYKVKERSQIMKSLNLQLLISTVLELAAVWAISYYMLPATFNQNNKNVVGALYKDSHWWAAAICVTVGLVSGFLIGIATDYYTSNQHGPVQEIAEQCRSGAAICIIYGLAVGYMSTIIPVFLLAITIISCVSLLGMLGVALAAIGMLSTLSVGLAIDAYGPICDNAGGIAEMARCPESTRVVTDDLDAAGNTTAAIGKGFAIGSAALVSLALYGAFVTRCRQSHSNPLGHVEVLDGWVFGSMFIGSMLPYWFSALTMKAVGQAAGEMVQEVKKQLNEFKTNKTPIDSNKCVVISTKASLKKMIAPGLLVILTPIIAGVFFGTRVVAGLLPGALLSGVQLAISMSNTGGAWDNAKKQIEGGHLYDKDIHGNFIYLQKDGTDILDVNGEKIPTGKDHNGNETYLQKDGEDILDDNKEKIPKLVLKNEPTHIAAVIGDTVGDPLKDTSGPSLNILVKLMAIISLVFANGFSQSSLLAPYVGLNSN